MVDGVPDAVQAPPGRRQLVLQPGTVVAGELLGGADRREAVGFLDADCEKAVDPLGLLTGEQLGQALGFGGPGSSLYMANERPETARWASCQSEASKSMLSGRQIHSGGRMARRPGRWSWARGCRW